MVGSQIYQRRPDRVLDLEYLTQLFKEHLVPALHLDVFNDPCMNHARLGYDHRPQLGIDLNTALRTANHLAFRNPPS